MPSRFLSRLFKPAATTRVSASDLIRRESNIGAQLFGPVPEGRSRDFFCLDESTWVWHEGWQDAQGKAVGITTRYELHPDRIIKVQDGQPNRVLDSQETSRLLLAAQWYYHLIAKNLYGLSTD